MVYGLLMECIWFFDGEFLYIGESSNGVSTTVMSCFVNCYNTQKEFFHDLDLLVSCNCIKKLTKTANTEEHEAEETSTTETTEETTEDCNEYEEILDRKESTDRDRINYFMETHSFPSISDMYNDKCFCCVADRKGNECKGRETCGKTWKRYEAITNPEWHHVSLATLANIDFDMLDEKRKLVCNINQILKDGIRNLYKCENHISFEVLERYVIRKCDELIRHNHLKAVWFSYIAQQLDEVRRNTIYLYTPYITIHRNRW